MGGGGGFVVKAAVGVLLETLCFSFGFAMREGLEVRSLGAFDAVEVVRVR